MKQLLVIALLTPLVATGCMSARYGQYERGHYVAADTLVMTKEDAMELAREGVGDEVIIDQIRATHSYFELSNNDILELKKAGVSERVINAMIKSSESAEPRRVAERYDDYPPYYPYYPYYGYAGYRRYPSFFSISFFVPFHRDVFVHRFFARRSLFIPRSSGFRRGGPRRY